MINSTLSNKKTSAIIDTLKQDDLYKDIPQLLFVEPLNEANNTIDINTHADYLVSWPDEQQPFLDVLEALAL